MTRVYLSGGMGGRVTRDVIVERKKARELCAKSGLHPMDPGLSEAKLWKRRRISDTMPRGIMRRFIEKDKWLIRRSDFLLVLTGDTPSDGTWREMCYAEKIEIPVVVVAPDRHAGRLMSWTNIEAATVQPTIERAVRWIVRRAKKARKF